MTENLLFTARESVLRPTKPDKIMERKSCIFCQFSSSHIHFHTTFSLANYWKNILSLIFSIHRQMNFRSKQNLPCIVFLKRHCSKISLTATGLQLYCIARGKHLSRFAKKSRKCNRDLTLHKPRIFSLWNNFSDLNLPLIWRFSNFRCWRSILILQVQVQVHS